MAEYNGQMAEWWNGGRIAELSNGGNGGMADGMAEWRPNGGRVEWQEWLPTYYFTVHAANDNTFKSFIVLTVYKRTDNVY
jgi:hypothetical protein